MGAYILNTLHIRLYRQAASKNLFAWLKPRLAARRQKRAVQRNIKYLRSLDPRIREDILVDASVLGDAPRTLSSFNPYQITPWRDGP
jgi:hypothetical protein